MRMAKIELNEDEVKLLNKALLFWYDHSSHVIDTLPTAFEIDIHNSLCKKLEEVIK